jgi:cytochrome P450
MRAAIDATTRTRGDLPPGPHLPRAVQAMLRTWRYIAFRQYCYKRYGDTFTLRIGGLGRSVLTKDRDAIRRLFTGDPLVKRHGNDLLRPFVGEHSVLVLEPGNHLARRKMLLPPFHGERVRTYARLMERLASSELDRIAASDVVTIQPIAQALTLDVILQAVLGIAEHDTRKRLRAIFDAFSTPLLAIAIFIPALGRRSRWNFFSRSAWRRKDELDALLFEHIESTRSDPRLSEREDILAMLVLARDEGGAGLSDEELRDELITLIAAGHETTATAIAWGVELLAHNPAVQTRAREGDDAYLEALVKEVLRICPPSPVGGARHVLEPFPIGPWTISPGVMVLVDAYGVHHDPEIYPRPEEFRPERFLEAPSDGYAFLPFGGGAHRCLGASLAMLEMKVVFRELLDRFELEPTTAGLAKPVARGPTIAPRGGGRVRVKRGAASADAPSDAATPALA